MVAKNKAYPDDVMLDKPEPVNYPTTEPAGSPGPDPQKKVVRVTEHVRKPRKARTKKTPAMT